MNETEAINFIRGALIAVLQVGGPLMGVALVVGLVVSLFQALTQIQEMTLAFVPKIFTMFVFMIFLLPYMMGTLKDFTVTLFDKMINLS